ncbi:MAG: class I SAM-dependent methyltransferase [Sedimentisphaerales bacterium]|nr:class I SAM-dependent methyltransferase [Sedimentisphaerales bacterium]
MSHNELWYEDFFDQWYLKYWIQPITAERTHKEVDAIIRFLGLTPECKVLDLCCGQGRHSLELSRRGFQVVGLDLSETLLEASRRQAQEENLSVEFIQADMRRISYENEFDGIFNFYTAFGYFKNDDDNQAVLNAVGKALKPGGRFLLDYPCLEGRMVDWKQQEFFEYDDGTIMLHEMIHDVFDQKIVNHVLYITKDNQRHRTGFTLRHYYGRELQQCLQKAGMKTIGAYGNLDGDKLTNRDIRVLVVAEKTSS